MTQGGSRTGAGRKQVSAYGKRKPYKFYLAPDEYYVAHLMIECYKSYRYDPFLKGLKFLVDPLGETITLITEDGKELTTTPTGVVDIDEVLKKIK